MQPEAGEGEEKEPCLPCGQPLETHGPSAIALDKARRWLALENNTARYGATYSRSSSRTSSG
jgi:hypothetical protein